MRNDSNSLNNCENGRGTSGPINKLNVVMLRFPGCHALQFSREVPLVCQLFSCTEDGSEM